MGKIKNLLIAGLMVAGLVISSAATVDAQNNNKILLKTRVDLLSGTPYVLVISYVPFEITSITCDQWTMLGINSWKGQNNFTIPAGPSVAVMNANKFDGYCKTSGSIRAHTDNGDFVGHLDRGEGNWSASTKLTFLP